MWYLRTWHYVRVTFYDLLLLLWKCLLWWQTGIRWMFCALYWLNFHVIATESVQYLHRIYWKYFNREIIKVLWLWPHIDSLWWLLSISGDQLEPIFMISIHSEPYFGLYKAVNPCIDWVRCWLTPLYDGYGIILGCHVHYNSQNAI